MNLKTNIMPVQFIAEKIKVFFLKITRHPDYTPYRYNNKVKRNCRHHDII